MEPKYKFLIMVLISFGFFSTFGLFVHAVMLRIRVLRLKKNGPLRSTAGWFWQREGLRTIKQFLLCMGVASTFFNVPPPPSDWTPVDLRDAIVAFVCVLMGFTSILDFWWFRRLASRIDPIDCPEVGITRV